jgi:hypothetical protein
MLAPDGVPVAMVGGAQVGYALASERPSLDRPWEGRAGVELHPFIRGYGASLIGFYASYGRRRHALVLPEALAPLAEDDRDRLPLTRPDFEISRRELRLEVALGTLIGTWDKPIAAITVVPYLVAHAGGTAGDCVCSGAVRLTSYEQSWGIALLVSPMVILDRSPPPPRFPRY